MGLLPQRPGFASTTRSPHASAQHRLGQYQLRAGQHPRPPVLGEPVEEPRLSDAAFEGPTACPPTVDLRRLRRERRAVRHGEGLRARQGAVRRAERRGTEVARDQVRRDHLDRGVRADRVDRPDLLRDHAVPRRRQGGRERLPAALRGDGEGCPLRDRSLREPRPPATRRPAPGRWRDRAARSLLC